MNDSNGRPIVPKLSDVASDIIRRAKNFALRNNQTPINETALTQTAKAQAQRQQQASKLQESVLKQLRRAQPTWQMDGKGLRGGAPRNKFDELRMQTQQPHLHRPQDLEPFPALVAPTVSTTTSSTGGSTPLPFEITIVSAADLQVKIQDGTVNNDFPSGMGTDSYILTITEEAYTGFYIYVTYDEDTLDITSLSLTASDTTLESEPGTLVIFIGWVDLTYDVDSNIILTPHNTQVGNILFEFIYGAHNGLPALLPVSVVATWIELPDIDPP